CCDFQTQSSGQTDKHRDGKQSYGFIAATLVVVVEIVCFKISLYFCIWRKWKLETSQFGSSRLFFSWACDKTCFARYSNRDRSASDPLAERLLQGSCPLLALLMMH
ncbi:unnamed protein product, partial [Brassica rapa subsp. trilocularis]